LARPASATWRALLSQPFYSDISAKWDHTLLVIYSKQLRMVLRHWTIGKFQESVFDFLGLALPVLWIND
jgi:hypothetical protein